MRGQKQHGSHNITSAPVSHSSDLRGRELRYLLSMAVRTVCFVVAVFVADGWLRWVLIVAAVFLPYIAVVLANAGKDARRNAHTPYHPPASGELPGTASTARENSSPR